MRPVSSAADRAVTSAQNSLRSSLSLRSERWDFFPREHRNWIRTSNVLERMNAEMKRRARVVQVFPSVEALVRLVGAVCCDQDDAWVAASNFMDRRSLARGYEPAARPPATRGDVERALALVEGAFDRKRRAA